MSSTVEDICSSPCSLGGLRQPAFVKTTNGGCENRHRRVARLIYLFIEDAVIYLRYAVRG
jgi:hypothetical protein